MTRWVVFVIGLAIAVSSSAVLAQSSSPNVSGIVSSPADMLRGETEKLKVEVELQKLAAVRTQFYFDWGYKVALGVAALLLLRWAVPQFSEISVPFGGGMFTAKRAPKQPNPAAPQDGPMPFADVAAALKRELAPGPAMERVVDRLEETGVLQAVGVARDTIYVCHRARPVRGTDQSRLHLYLDADDNAILAKVEKVTYRLHPTFAQPEVTVTNATNQFALDLTAWGEFMLYALVYFKGQPKPVELQRYLNF